MNRSLYGVRGFLISILISEICSKGSRMTTSTMKQRPIVTGPSKRDVENGIFDNNPRQVCFETDGEIPLKVGMILDGAEAEDGSRESWIVKGRIQYITRGSKQFKHPTEQVKFYYRTDHRSGSIDLPRMLVAMN